MAGFGIDDLKNVIEKLAAVFEEETDRLNDLDTKLGDGDHGRSMNLGFKALAACAREKPFDSMTALLMDGGMQFNEAAGSTIGILMMSGLRAAGKAIADRSEIGRSDAVAMLDAAIEALKKRGKSDVGQKTILDSLQPALVALQNAEVDLAGIVEAAENGAESTRQMQPVVGRARWFAERSQDEIDPGAVSGALIIGTICEYLRDR